MYMKIAIDVREFSAGRKTGIGSMLSCLLRKINKYEKNFYFILIGDKNTKLPFPLADNCDFYVYNFYPTILWDQMAPIITFQKKRFDLYYSPYYKRSLFLPVPSIVTVCDLIDIAMPKRSLHKYISLPLIRFYSNKTKVLTISKYSRDELEKVGIKNISCVYPCVREIGAKNKYDFYPPLNSKGKYIFSLGDDRPHKNMDFLILAYKRMRALFRNSFSLVIAGGKEKYREKIDGGGEIISLGVLDDLDIDRLYNGASIFVFPSLIEGFGLPPLEAMKAGCPVLSSGMPPMPEILGDGAIYFNPLDLNDFAQKVERILSSPEELSTLSIKGRERASIFNEEKFCLEMAKVFKEAAGCAG